MTSTAQAAGRRCRASRSRSGALPDPGDVRPDRRRHRPRDGARLRGLDRRAVREAGRRRTARAWEAADAAIKAADPTSSVPARTVVQLVLEAGDRRRRPAAPARGLCAVADLRDLDAVDGTVGDNPRARGRLPRHARRQGPSATTASCSKSVSLHPMMGVYLIAPAQPEGRPAHRPRARRELRARGDAAVLDRPARAERRRHACKPSAGGRSRPTAAPTSPAWRKVFTGWSWACPAGAGQRLLLQRLVERRVRSRPRASSRCSATPQYHSPEVKTFLGTDDRRAVERRPEASLATALDTLRRHPNVGPFIGKQLIQRLVTSNPSPEYVAAVAARSPTTAAACAAT